MKGLKKYIKKLVSIDTQKPIKINTVFSLLGSGIPKF
jgi:hypothetical protein